MRRVFGKKKAEAPAPTLEDASKGLGGRIDQMDAKIASLENELRVFKDKIKNTKSPAAKKQLQKRAMEVLKRKRMYEQQRDQISAQAFNIDQTHFSLESAKASVSTVAAMKAANKDLKRTLRKDLNIDDMYGLKLSCLFGWCCFFFFKNSYDLFVSAVTIWPMTWPN